MIISEHRFRPIFLPQSIVLYIPYHIIKNITSNLVALNFQKPCSQRYFCLDFKYRNAFNTFQISLKCKNINYYFNKYHTRYKQCQHVYHCCKTWVMATQLNLNERLQNRDCRWIPEEIPWPIIKSNIQVEFEPTTSDVNSHI